MTSAITFAKMDQSHLSGAMRISIDVGWPHRLEDWAFIASFSQGVVALEEDRVVGTAIATPFGEVGMVNLIIVDAAMRGRGLGRKLMTEAMKQITPSIWRLVATQDGLPLYEKLGFVATGTISQHQGPVAEVAHTSTAVWANQEDMTAIRAMDKVATRMERSTLYEALEGNARFAVLREDNQVSGFAVLRNFGRGEVIGPVVATSVEDAKGLMTMIMSTSTGRFLRVDVDANSGLSPWLENLGLMNVGDGISMQIGRSEKADTPQYQIYALAAQALG